MTPQHRKRCRRYDVPGDAHFLTFSCFQRRPLLDSDRSRGWMLQAIEQGRQRAPFDLWAYVVMPEHVHLVIYPEHETRISAVLSTIKQSVSKRAIHWLRQNAPTYLRELEDVRPSGRRSFRFGKEAVGTIAIYAPCGIFMRRFDTSMRILFGEVLSTR